MPTISRGFIKSYDSSTHSASVQIAGSLAVWLDAVPVSDAISPSDVVAGRECGVICFTDDSPTDAAVVTIHNALPIGSHRLRDADGDTYLDVERTANENKIAGVVGGTLRWLLQNTTPHLTLTGDAFFTGAIGTNDLGALQAGYYAQVSYVPADPAGLVGLGVYIGQTIGSPTATSVVGVQGKAALTSSATAGRSVIGLDFQASVVGLGSGAYTVLEQSAIRLQTIILTSSGVTVTAMNGVSLAAPSLTSGTAITTYTGFKMLGSASTKIVTAIGFFYGSFSGAGVVSIPLDLDGPARTTNTDGSVHRMNFQFASRTRAFGTGDGVIGLAYATTNPTTNPAGGIVIWADAGSGDTKFKGAGGVIVKLPTGGATNVTGARGGNVALANLLTALAGYGLITDSTT